MVTQSSGLTGDAGTGGGTPGEIAPDTPSFILVGVSLSVEVTSVEEAPHPTHPKLRNNIRKESRFIGRKSSKTVW